MTNRFKLLLAGVAISLSASIAHAADMALPEEQVVAESGSGFYLGSVNALTFIDHTDFDIGGGATNIENDYDLGYYSALRVGYNFGNMGFVGARAELELGYGSASVDNHTVNGAEVDSIDSFGDVRTIQGFVNGYIDVPLAQDGVFAAITPYVGGGAGFINLDMRKQGVSATGTVIDDDDTAFGYHLDAGVGLNLQRMGIFQNLSLLDNTTLDIGYRFTGSSDFSLRARDGTSSETDFKSHAVTFGFRKQF